MILLDNQQFCATVIILVWKIKLVSHKQSGVSIMGIGSHSFRFQCTLLTNLMDLYKPAKKYWSEGDHFIEVPLYIPRPPCMLLQE